LGLGLNRIATRRDESGRFMPTCRCGSIPSIPGILILEIRASIVQDVFIQQRAHMDQLKSMMVRIYGTVVPGVGVDEAAALRAASFSVE
jgi:hypothetical protein